MPSRIAYFINQYPKVSHSFIRREVLALERQGVHVLRIALRGWDAQLVDEDDRAEQERTRFVLRGGLMGLIPAVVFAMSQGPGRFLSALRTAWQLGRRSDRPRLYHLVYLAEACQVLAWVKSEGVTHLHAHFGTNSAEVALLTRLLGGPPYSFTVHGPDEFDKPEFLGVREKVRHAAFVVAISSFGRSQLYRWIDTGDWPKVKVVHCGLERGFHEGTDGTAPPTAPRLVCVGRLSGQKGQLLLVDALARLAALDVPVELVLAGDGEMREAIEARARALGVSSRLRITGWISSTQVREELLGARALVLPSFAEGLPVVIMEAMALGRPVVTTFVAGIPELVRDGVDGWLFPAGDVERLVSAMRASLAADVSQLKAMGAAARARVLERHDVDVEAAKLVALFRTPAGSEGVILTSRATA